MNFAPSSYPTMNLSIPTDLVPPITPMIFRGLIPGIFVSMVTKDTKIPGINPRKIIGVIGGTKSVGIDKFIVGYEEGAKFIDKETKVLVSYSNSFGDPAKGKELTLAQFQQGADIVYQVAGCTGEEIGSAHV